MPEGKVLCGAGAAAADGCGGGCSMSAPPVAVFGRRPNNCRILADVGSGPLPRFDRFRRGWARASGSSSEHLPGSLNLRDLGSLT
jgi:hypothetical protein